MMNDSLDSSLHNKDFYIHPDFPTLPLVIATKDIVPDQQLFLGYAGTMTPSHYPCYSQQLNATT